jgi:predicted heme/steroid binding protein
VVLVLLGSRARRVRLPASRPAGAESSATVSWAHMSTGGASVDRVGDLSDSVGRQEYGIPAGFGSPVWTQRRPMKTICQKVEALILCLALLVVVVVACEQGESATAASTANAITSTPTSAAGAPTTISTSASEERVFTAAELAEFDGKEGRPGYVAVDGVVYDVTNSLSWPDGEHIRCRLGAMAGRDLSAEIAEAPASMRTLLANMPVVGRLAQ